MDSNIIMLIAGFLISLVMLLFAVVANRKEQPKALFILFFTEMWERFSFYGMRALLVLYMTSPMEGHNHGLGFGDAEANKMYGAYMALVYALPLVGGMLADRLLGFRKAIFLGGILMAIGHFVLAIPSETSFFLGLAFIIGGNGFFKPNISSFVGKFYGENDPRRDAGFSIFYMGINIGALMGGLLCGYLGQEVNWHLGFGMAGIFMLLGLGVFSMFQGVLEGKGVAPDPAALQKKHAFGLNTEWVIYLLGFVVIPIYAMLVVNYRLMGNILWIVALLAFAYLIMLAFREERAAREKMFAAVIMIIFSTLFWAFFEQGGGALNLYADRNVDMTFGNTELSSAAVNNSINPLWIIILSPLFALMWRVLGKRGLEPGIPVKFALGFLQCALGFYMFVIGAKTAGDTGMVSMFYFVMGYLFMSSGELCLSPIGLSMVTKLSPAKLVGFVMGAWFLASACGQYVAGLIGAMMEVPSEGGEVSLGPVESLAIYTTVFEQIALIAAVSGGIILLLSPFIRKWMHGVK